MAEAWRIHRIKATVPIFEVLEKLGIPVEVRGTHQIHCPNPHHDDRRPSARVYAEDNRVHCFTCGKSWDVLDLVELHVHVPGIDGAVQWIEHHFDLPDASQAGPEIMLGVVNAPTRPNLSQVEEDTEAVLRHHHMYVEPFPLATYTLIWFCFDTAKTQHKSGIMGDDEYLEFLTQLKKRAFHARRAVPDTHE